MAQESNYAPYTLGLDIGIASSGAALLAEDRILALYVRTFDKAETAKEGESLNKIRRESRLARRRLRRRRHRLERLRNLFKRESLIDQASCSAFVSTISPWQLRAEGLDRLLTNTEWAATLYHIVKNRGFQSTRKSEASDKEAGKMLAGVNHNAQLIDTNEYRTPGEIGWKHEAFKTNKRNKGGSYTHTFGREVIKDEVHQLFKAQRKYRNGHASEEFEAQVIEILMSRRAALAGEELLKMVGKCTFENEEYRAPKASYTAEKFVWLTKLNNLRVSEDGKIRALSGAERELLLTAPYFDVKTRLTYKQIKKKLELSDVARFVGLRYDDKNPEGAPFFEAKAFHKLRNAYEKAGLKTEWARDAQNPDRIDILAYAQSVYKDDNDAREYLSKEGVEPEIIEAVLEVSFSQFLNLSLKALKKIVPYMEQGQRYDEAVISAGYKHHSQLNSGEKTTYLPPFLLEDIRNPVVFRSLNQSRKLLNAIVKKHGPPMAVNVEVARDLSKPFKERSQIQKEQEKYRKNKEGDIKQFIENFGAEPRGLDLVKYRLYREQNGQCALSQKPIDLNRLMEAGYVEVDHALPYSRSFDNGMTNKILVHTVENRNKGNQTPYEYLGGKDDTEQWQRFAAWVNGNKGIRQAKRNRLLKADFGAEEAQGFRDRNLTDTRFVCKLFKNHIETHLKLAKQSTRKKCTVVSGRMTGFMRARWGLHKHREDGDLHHALDAAVVAACTGNYVKRLADYSRRGELEHLNTTKLYDPETGEIIDIAAIRQFESEFPTPWPNFRQELLARLSPVPGEKMPSLQGVKPIRVSRAPQRRGYGAAHRETIRSIKPMESAPEGEKPQSSIRRKLSDLKLSDLPKIVGFEDPRNKGLIKAIEERLIAFGGDGKKAFAEPLYKPSKDEQGPLVRTVKLLETQQSGIPVRGGIADNGDMLRIDLFRVDNKFFAVPLYVSQAVLPSLPNKAALPQKPEAVWPEMDEGDFLFSVYPNDWLKITLKNRVVEGYYGGFDRSNAQIGIWTHDRNQSIGKNGLVKSIGIKTALTLEKFHVDVLGNLYPCRKEARKPLNHR